MSPFQCLLESEFHSFNVEIQQQLPQAGVQCWCQGTAASSTLFYAQAEMDAPTGSPGQDKIIFRSAMPVHSSDSCTCFFKPHFLPKLPLPVRSHF